MVGILSCVGGWVGERRRCGMWVRCIVLEGQGMVGWGLVELIELEASVGISLP